MQLKCKEPTVVVYALIPTCGRQKHADLCENKVSMVYIVSPGQSGLPKKTQSLKVNKQGTDLFS